MSKNLSSVQIFLSLYLLSSFGLAQEIDWPYDDYYTEDKLYIHAIVNYDIHPMWHDHWENNLFRQNMLRMSFGSISLTELFSDVSLAMNQEVTKGIWFRYATAYYATHHRNEQDKHLSTGFEKYIFKSFSLFAYGNPHFEKEEIDIHYGISLTNKDRTSYFRVAYIDVDTFWDDKNNINSVNLTRPWRLGWETNVRFKSFRFFSSGRYENGIERIFERAPASFDFDYQRKKINDMIFKLYYYRTPKSFLEISYSCYQYDEAKRFHHLFYDYEYQNRIESYKIGYVTPIGERYRLRFGSFALLQNAAAAHYREHDYSRHEIIPYIFGEMYAGPGIVEAGYMVSKYAWDYSAPAPIPGGTRDDYIDKVKIAYTLNLANRAYLQFALSHVTAIWGFGGGNVQFWIQF
ncbi:hypothetical protein EH223_20230 [candidate division KSB1 bacterium]|nr:hypothetical protein [candidate division KSB1 bacterium]RQW00042.1 MAG: hypothetical protein EH223_20230 [candidate division KSB1 bacterium]